jgi:hypothetical protein
MGTNDDAAEREKVAAQQREQARVDAANKAAELARREAERRNK